MMDISAKFSLYDVLAIIIPGGIIMASINPCGIIEWLHDEMILCCGCVLTSADGFDFAQCVALLSVSYVFGLINNWFSDGVFRGFRNNRNAIENELLKVLRQNGNMHLRDYVGSSYDSVKNPEHSLPGICIRMILSIIQGWLRCGNRDAANFTGYYKAYYALSWHNKLGSVPLIESQVALLRNLIVPSVVMAVLYASKLNGTGQCLLIAFAICLFVVMTQRQNKVYQLIWESANYYKL